LLRRDEALQTNWKDLKIFGNEARVYILTFLLKSEMASLSDILHVLKHNHQMQITISGVFKHIRILEKAGLVRRESGGIKLAEPDARKTIYFLEGKERVERLLQLGQRVTILLNTSSVFSKTAHIARRIQGIGPRYAVDLKLLRDSLDRLEKETGPKNLTEDEKEKMKLWKIIANHESSM